MNSSPTPDSWINRSIGDRQRYRLDKRLGAGGMGDVFLAMDTRLGLQVALKLLKDTLFTSMEMRKRFEREVEVCAALQSDHIVKVTDSGVTEEGIPFYVMEYLRGETLRELLRRERSLSVERTVRIITQVCKGLQLAHQGVTLWRNEATQSEHIQVVHRDLKPDNIFLVFTDSAEWVKILDFGIAKIRNQSSEQTNLTSAFLGTLRYAAPEQLKGEINLDGRADIYSLGIILYEMLSHADPFGFSIKARSISEAFWIIAHATEPPTPLRAQPGCDNLSPQLEAVVMRCLQKEPEQRFATVEELNQALQAAASSMVGGNQKETIDQHIRQIEGSDEETIPRVLNPPPETKRDTIDQIPVKKSNREQTIDQIPSLEHLEKPSVPDETSCQPPPLPQSRQRSINFLPIGIGLAIGLTILSGIYAYIQFQPSKVLDEITTLKTKENYEECINKSEKISQDSTIYQEVQGILNECRMKYAIKLAEKSEPDCVKASTVYHRIPEDNPLYSKTKERVRNLCDVSI